jgi:hypothetical protein
MPGRFLPLAIGAHMPHLRCTRKGYAANSTALKRQELRNQPRKSIASVLPVRVAAGFPGLPSIWASERLWQLGCVKCGAIEATCSGGFVQQAEHCASGRPTVK